MLKDMVVESGWPPDAIAIDRQALRLAPSGTDRFGARTAKAMIGFVRTAAVRDALILMGVDPSLIVMEEERAPDADGPMPSIDPAVFRCVAIDYGD